MNKRDLTITNSAFCQARQKLKHTAFIELNECTLDTYYAPEREGAFKTYKGYRLVGIDASKILLPNTPEIKKEFGTTDTVGVDGNTTGEYASMMFECGYDVLNHLCLHVKLFEGNTYEVSAAKEMLSTVDNKYINSKKDLFIFDRGYSSYEMLSHLQSENLAFVIRVSKGSFPAIDKFFTGEETTNSLTLTTIQRSVYNKRYAKLELPTALSSPVRFIKVVLDTGEVEVLATSLLDETEFPAHIFKDLYYKRWQTETFFLRLKERLGLENFTGKTVESVKQDFWSTIYLSNYESILTEDLDEELSKKQVKNQQKVNKAISYNLIKNKAFELLLGSPYLQSDQIIKSLTTLFLMNPCQIRPGRTAKRNKETLSRSLRYQRRKHVF